MNTPWKTIRLAALSTWVAVAADTHENPLTIDRTLTILVYDYAGVQADTLQESEQETSRIFRYSGVDIAWLPCRIQGSPIPLECPQASPMTPVLRLVPRLQPVRNKVPAEAIGYSNGDFATISVEFAKRLWESGVARFPEILGHVMAHEIGHLLLPGEGHSTDGIMRAQWSLNEWRLLGRGKLNFAPEQSRFLRAELLRRLQAVAEQTR
jgi:hypothetical protein